MSYQAVIQATPNEGEHMHPDLKGYLQEIARLRRLPEDANVRDERMTRECGGPETPEERLYTIECIFGEEGWHFPTR